MTVATVRYDPSDAGAALRFAGRLVVTSLADLRAALPSAETLDASGELALDLSEVEALDTAGAWLLVDLEGRLTAQGVSVRLEGVSDHQRGLIDTVRANLPGPVPAVPRRGGFAGWLERVGEHTATAGSEFVQTLGFSGEFVVKSIGLMLRPWRFRYISLVHHMQEVGLAAVPIVSLMAFLIGIVLAFQGAAQLQQFGAEVFVVDLIGISILRELGILLTAIIVAGRTASAFTAAIGSMKMREEIDAMRTLGLDPMEVLVIPRVMALVLTLPILGFIAAAVGIIGGAAMSWIQLGVSPGMFRTRFLDSIDVSNYLIGMVKAPFFAVIIGIIGCFQGMQVEGNAESLGRLTSRSVVQAIFMVIVIDAVFSIFFAVIGI
jgi:phospholipid/cholesterol/gamma-HCH transport system permease protein